MEAYFEAEDRAEEKVTGHPAIAKVQRAYAEKHNENGRSKVTTSWKPKMNRPSAVNNYCGPFSLTTPDLHHTTACGTHWNTKNLL